MQLSAKLKNKSVAYSALLKARVNMVVSDSGDYYQNISGINGAINNPNHWFKIYNGATGGGATAIVIDKVAADISGTDPNFLLDLAGSAIPAFPAALSAYVDLLGDGNYLMIDPLNYNPVSKVLSGMNSPVDFAAQLIKVVAL